MEKRRIEKDILTQLYIHEGLTIAEVAKKLNAGNATISRELKRHGIAKPANYSTERHGLSNSRQYGIWAGMKQRCTNARETGFERYGGAGITYDEKWDTFQGFWDDMSDGYSDNATLDRIDSRKGYCKDNCRWASYGVQNNNRSNNVKLSHNGKLITAREIIELTGLPQNTVYRRIREGWSVEDIINKPPQTNNQMTKGRK